MLRDLDHPSIPSRPAAPPSRTAIWAGIWVLYLVWGSTYLGIAVAVETIPPFLMAAVRFLLAGAILLGWSAARAGGTFRRPSRREVRDSAIVGALLLGGGMGLVAYGELSVPSGIAALLVAMMPLWVAVLGRAVLGERLSRLAAAGVALGLVGVAVLVSPGDAALDGVDAVHLGALLLSPICWAAGSLFAAHRARLPERPLVATGLQMALGGLVLLAMSVAAGEPARFDVAAVSGRSVLAFAYLTLVGSIVAFTVYGWLLRVAPLPKVATYAYVNPVVAVILGWIILGEPITARTVLAGAIIVAAVALIITARSRVPAPGGLRRIGEEEPGDPMAGEPMARRGDAVDQRSGLAPVTVEVGPEA
jgi:drug/metabolite transporter (DMT)-like permease